MLSLQTIETALTVITILFVLWGLGICVRIWWAFQSGEVEEYRKAYRVAMVQKWCCGEEEVNRGPDS